MCGGIISWIFVAKNSQLWQNKVNYVKGMRFILAYIHSFISMCEWNGGEKQKERASGWSEFIHNYRQSSRVLRGRVIGFLSISRSHGALTCPGSTRLDAAAESECDCVSWHNREVTNTQRNVNGKHPISNWPIALQVQTHSWLRCHSLTVFSSAVQDKKTCHVLGNSKIY